MAKPTEQRVNKAFVTPDLDRPAIDPGASDIADQSYDSVEHIRAERALAGDATGQDRSYDSLEASRAARVDAGDTSAADYQASVAAGREGSLAATKADADTSYDRIEQLRVDRAGGDEPTQMIDTPPSGRDLLTGTEDPGVLEGIRLDRWELEQAAQNYDAGVDLHADHAADIHAAHSADAPATTPDEGGLDIRDGFTPD